MCMYVFMFMVIFARAYRTFLDDARHGMGRATVGLGKLGVYLDIYNDTKTYFFF